MRLSDLKGKRVGILGFGREGQSVARLLEQQGEPSALLIFDDAPVPGRVSRPLAAAPQAGLDVLFKSPGISFRHPAVSDLAENGCRISSASNLFFAENAGQPSPARTVVVTGTKGKSTTATLLHHVLTRNGIDAALGGNIGIPLTDLLGQSPDVVVAELSSYQLADFEACPDLAVLLNLYQEHLDWHGGVTEYHRDKLGWLARCSGTEVLANAEDSELRQWLKDHPNVKDIQGSRFSMGNEGISFAAGDLLLAAENAPLKGRHNLLNLCAVLAAAEYLGIAAEAAVEALTDFQGLPHRLQELGVRDGVLWVNDSISTTPQSTLAALRSYPAAGFGQRILIIGGQDRGLDWRSFIDALNDETGLTLLLMPEVGDRVGQQLGDGASFEAVPDLASAVNRANKMAKAGDLVLLSPGAPSYGAFKNFEERGTRFRSLAGFGQG